MSSSDSNLCSEYYWRNLYSCDLAPPLKERERLYDQLERKESERAAALAKAAEAEAKAARLRKETKLIRRRLKELGDRESQNILELEADEFLASSGPIPQFNLWLATYSPSKGFVYETPPPI